MLRKSDNFVRWLKNFDKDLKAGWSKQHECFVVEHKDNTGKPYIVLKSDRLNGQAKEALWELRERKRASGLRFLFNLEQEEANAEAFLQKQQLTQHEDFAAEAYRHMQVVQGERGFNN